jgi:acyl dehydratase
VTTTIDRGRLRLVAKATGQTDPVYTDVDAARAAGHPDLLVPPTYLFGIELEQPEGFGRLTEHGVEVTSLLHASQTFDYVTAVHAGDEVTATSSITDVQVKKGGALTLVHRQTDISRDGSTVASLTTIIAIRGAA